MTPADLHAAIADRFGLTRRPLAGTEVASAAEKLACQLGVPLSELLVRLEGDPELARSLAGHLTVDETYFLRQPEHLELVVDRIKRCPASTMGRPLTIWSAGCAHGEEPYSIAVLVCERAPWARPFVRILASDLSYESIQQARQGRFNDWSMRDVPPWFRDRYFQRVQGGWQIEPAVRSLVRFEHLAVLEHLRMLPDRSVDMVLFRNVAIYLEPATLELVYQGFSRVLADDGLLILGPSDPSPARSLFALGAEPCGSVYRHPEVAASPVAAKPARERRCQPRANAPESSTPRLVAPARPAAASGKAWAGRARALYDEAAKLGNLGASEAALGKAGELIRLAPDWSAGYALRATLLLAASRHREALADLRHAAYLAPEELQLRFLCATTLRAAQLADQARAEARALADRLRQMPPAALLEDGRTTVAELLGAALELAEEGR
jgi:chemotaxis protein methyltransferase CheR